MGETDSWLLHFLEAFAGEGLTFQEGNYLKGLPSRQATALRGYFIWEKNVSAVENCPIKNEETLQSKNGYVINVNTYIRNFFWCFISLLAQYLLALIRLESPFISISKGATFLRNICGMSSSAEDLGCTQERFSAWLLPQRSIGTVSHRSHPDPSNVAC